jgi:hypothetical protein
MVSITHCPKKQVAAALVLHDILSLARGTTVLHCVHKSPERQETIQLSDKALGHWTSLVETLVDYCCQLYAKP